MKKKQKNHIWLLLFLLLLGVFLSSGYRVGSYLFSSSASANQTEELIQSAVTVRPVEPTPAPSTQNTPVSSSSEPAYTQPVQPDNRAPIEVDFAALHQKSEDIIAWLYSPRTPINYHVAQAEDNDYYLYRMINGKENKSGTLFMDYRNNPSMSDQNTLIYGHAMSIGTMFGTLERYKQQSYYDEHPVMYLLTPDADYALDLVAGYMTDVQDPVFTIPETGEDTQVLLTHVLKKSAFRTKAELPEDPRLVTLSTCAYDFEDARFVVVGVLRILEK